MASLCFAVFDLYSLVMCIVGFRIASIAVGSKSIFHRIATKILIAISTPVSLFMQENIIGACCHVGLRKWLLHVIQIDIFPLIDIRTTVF